MYYMQLLLMIYCFHSVGISINLICEQLALYIINSTREIENFDSKIMSQESMSVTERLIRESEEVSRHEHSHRSNSRSHSRQLSVSNSRSRMDSCEVGAVVAVFANANDPRALLKAYVLEGAIAVHSIIMGISLGSMQNDELTNIKILMIAYAVHQFLEGISLGYIHNNNNDK